MRKISTQRLAILIDAENLEIQARNQFGCRINFDALVNAMNGREIVRMMYFTQINHSSAFRYMLEEGLGIEYRMTPKNSDMWIFASAMTLSAKVDTIALVAGDLDYLPMVQLLQASGVRVEVWSFSGCTALELMRTADEFHAFDERILLSTPSKT